jgi:signal transduction histidine kinase
MNTWQGTLGLSHSHSIWRFAGPMATSQKVILPVLGLLFLNSFVAGIFPEEETRSQQLGVLLVASLTAWLFFTLFGSLIRFTMKHLTAWRVIAVALVYALTELIRISTVFAFIDVQQMEGVYSEVFRVTGALSTGLLFFSAIATVFNDSAEYRAAFGERATRLSLAQAMLREAEANISQTRVQIITKVRRRLNRELNQALVMSKSMSAQAAVMAEELFRVSDEVVRPLSAELVTEVSSKADAPIRPVSARVPFHELIRCATTANPFRPLEITVVSALLSAPTLLLIKAPVLIVVWVLFIAAVFGLSALGQRVVAPRLPNMRIVWRIVLITVLTATPMPMFVAIALVPSVEELELTPTVIVYAFILGATIGWAIAVAEGLRSAHARILDELSELDRQLHWSSVRAQCQLWLDQKRLALTLHNTVQGNLLAAAMKLKGAVEAGPDATEAVVPEVQRLLTSSLQLNPGSSSRRTLSDVTAELNNTWAPLIELTVHCEPELAALLARDLVALEIVAEILTEFQTNSLKHGSATRSEVQVTQPSLNTVALRMHNNGSPITDDTAGIGLGSQFIDSVAIAHETANLPDGVEIRLEIPVLIQ